MSAPASSAMRTTAQRLLWSTRFQAATSSPPSRLSSTTPTTLTARGIASPAPGGRRAFRPLASQQTQPPKGANKTVKFWPFLAIIVLGTGAFVWVTKNHADRRNGPVRRYG
ncbi:Uu.00g043530.m01.CDS01 [Anthostomella pinea]|uniref:Uu.00g043530.m01.CDS01 n=1 Tax=Anthostomella pinea TaxID=933095 RepID=A0AAI8VAT1_9PEZI|nr:Uu.00g043530.m01.CDS01 [Anthostomella pinea]